MSRPPAVSRQGAQARKRSSSPVQVMQRLASSWTRWRQKRTAARLHRQQEAARQLLTPLLLEALTPMAAAMERLSDRQQETHRLMMALAELAPAPEPQTLELLVEILQTLQPEPEQVIKEALGLSTQPSSSPSSVS